MVLCVSGHDTWHCSLYNIARDVVEVFIVLKVDDIIFMWYMSVFH
jgi:hypothetical protein